MNYFKVRIIFDDILNNSYYKFVLEILKRFQGRSVPVRRTSSRMSFVSIEYFVRSFLNINKQVYFKFSVKCNFKFLRTSRVEYCPFYLFEYLLFISI